MVKNSSGAWGEVFAARYFRNNGFTISASNFYIRGGEIDLIVENAEHLVFVEVKTRGKNAIDSPSAAVDTAKQKRISLCAAAYIQRYGCTKQPRFDVVEVLLDNGMKPTCMNHIENAFDSIL